MLAPFRAKLARGRAYHVHAFIAETTGFTMLGGLGVSYGSVRKRVSSIGGRLWGVWARRLCYVCAWIASPSGDCLRKRGFKGRDGRLEGSVGSRWWWRVWESLDGGCSRAGSRHALACFAAHAAACWSVRATCGIEDMGRYIRCAEHGFNRTQFIRVYVRRRQF